jgi:hypothetical protein
VAAVDYAGGEACYSGNLQRNYRPQFSLDSISLLLVFMIQLVLEAVVMLVSSSTY